MSSFGLNSSLFKEKFTKSSTQSDVDTVYTTENFVRNHVASYLNTESTVNISISQGATVESTVTGTNKTIVNIGLNANISDLNDVQFDTAPTSGDYLMFDGTNWGTGPGSSIQLGINQLKDFTGSYPSLPNSVLFTNDGTSIQFREDKGIQQLTTKGQYSGIQLFPSQSYPYTVQIQSDPSGFQTTSNKTDSDFYIISRNGIGRKILMSDINISGFTGVSQSISSVLNGYFSSTNTTSYEEGLCYVGSGQFNLNLSNYFTGSSDGFLPISKGGTSSGTSADARVSLGLSSKNYDGSIYPYQIMSYSSPEFRNTMVGDNIRLVPVKNGNITTEVSGSGYTLGGSYYIENDEGDKIDIKVSVIIFGGSYAWQLKNPIDGFPLLTETKTYSIQNYTGSPGSGGSVRIVLDSAYINFGGTQGDGGIGFKYDMTNNQKVLKVKTDSTKDWEDITSGVSSIFDLNDVTPNSPDFGGDILIYDFPTKSFRSKTVSGAITINASGFTTLNPGTFSFTNIQQFQSMHVSDFQNITGTTSRIQPQLDSKVESTVTTPDTRDRLMILNPNTTTGVGVLPNNPELNLYQQSSPQLPISLSSTHQGVSFRNIYDGFVGPQTFPGSSIPVLEVCLMEQLKGVGSTIELTDFLHLICTGGIKRGSQNSRLDLSIENLPPYSDFVYNYNDVIAVGPDQSNSNISNKKITIKDLLKVPTYPGAFSNIDPSYYFTGALAFVENQPNLGTGTSFLGVAVGDSQRRWYAFSPDAIFS